MFVSVLALTLAQPSVDPSAESLTLDAAIEIAQTNTREVIRAEADVLLMDVVRAQALGIVLPDVSFSLPVGYNLGKDVTYEVRNPRTTEFVDIPVGDADGDGVIDAGEETHYGEPFIRPTLSVRQLVFDGGRWWLLISRADDIEAQRKASLQAVRNNVRLNVVRRFFGLERARQTLETFRLQLELSKEQLQRAQRRLDSGQGKPGDVATAQRNLGEDRVAFARREFVAAEARRNFNLALGRPANLPVKLIVPAAVTTATAALPAIVLPPEAVLVESALAGRPEMRRQRATLEIIHKNIGIRKADYLPRLTVGASLRKGWGGAGSRKPDRIFGDPLDNLYLSFNATLYWNWFRGFATDAAVQEAEISLKKSIADYENLQRNIAREVESRVQNLRLQVAVYDLARDAVGSASEAVRLVRNQYALGKTSSLELRDAELKFTQSKLRAINARLDVEVARAELVRAVGGPIDRARSR